MRLPQNEEDANDLERRSTSNDLFHDDPNALADLQSNADSTEQGFPVSKNTTMLAPGHLLEMKEKIRFYKQAINIGNVTILTLSILIILMYFTTPVFDGVKLRDKLRYCNNAADNFFDFSICREVCTDSYLCSCFSDSDEEEDTDGRNNGESSELCTGYTENDEKKPTKKECSAHSKCEQMYNLLSSQQFESLKDVCSADRLSTEERNKCADKCAISECCWVEDDEKKGIKNCQDSHYDLCLTYFPCSLYYKGAEWADPGIGPIILDSPSNSSSDAP